jgi:hypothetical protein
MAGDAGYVGRPPTGSAEPPRPSLVAGHRSVARGVLTRGDLQPPGDACRCETAPLGDHVRQATVVVSAAHGSSIIVDRSVLVNQVSPPHEVTGLVPAIGEIGGRSTW